MFLFQWQRKTVDDGTENFKKFSDAVKAFGLVDELEEDVVDRATNVRAEVEKFAINAMQRRLQEVTFSWVFGVK